MDFNKHNGEIIDFLTSGYISDNLELSDDDGDAGFEILDCLQKDTGKNDSGDSSDDGNEGDLL